MGTPHKLFSYFGDSVSNWALRDFPASLLDRQKEQPSQQMESLPEIVWRILSEKGVEQNYKTWLSDPMPRPKLRFLVPTFDQETWEGMIRAIQEALEIWKAQIAVETEKPEPSIKVSS